jgi:integrase
VQLEVEDGIIADFVYGLAERTQKQYICYFSLFLSRLHPPEGLDIEQQASWFLTKAREPLGSEWVQEGLITLLKSLTKKKVKQGVYKAYYKAVKSFCDNNGINLQWKRISKRFVPKGGNIGKDRIPTIEEIKQILKHPDRRVKPLVLVTLSSGIRIGAWQYLQWKHIIPVDKDCQNLDGDNPEREVAAAKIIVYAGEPEQYLGLITPEAFYELKEWMDHRRKAGEKISEESWLMRDRFPWDSGYGAAKPQRIRLNGIIKILRRAITEQDVRGKPITGEGETVRYPFRVTHGFRKFFETKAYQAGMSRTDVYFLVDHELGIDSSYVRPTEQELIRSYFKIIDCLTINGKSLENSEILRNQQELATKMLERDNTIQSLQQELRFFKREFTLYKEQYGGRHLTKHELGKIEQMLEQMKNMPSYDGEDAD